MVYFNPYKLFGLFYTPRGYTLYHNVTFIRNKQSQNVTPRRNIYSGIYLSLSSLPSNNPQTPINPFMQRKTEKLILSKKPFP